MPSYCSENAGVARKHPQRALAARLASVTNSMKLASRARRARTTGMLTAPAPTSSLSAPKREKLRHTPELKAKTIGACPLASAAPPSASSSSAPPCPSVCGTKRPAPAPTPRAQKRRKMDVVVSDMPTPVALTGEAPTVNVGLPKKLIRPEWKDITKEVKLSLHPGLGDVPTNYIREKLLSTGLADAMRKVIASVQCNAEVGLTLPAELPVVVRDLGGDLPTHMLAVYAPRTAPTDRQRVTLFPTHNMILSSHCTNLPPMANTPEAADCEEYDFDASYARLRIPVVPLCIPHPETFPHLSQYLYTKKSEPLMAALLPPPPPEDPEDDDEEDEDEADVNPRVRLAQRLARTYEPRALLARAMTINGLWRNAVALGVYDEKMWMTMDVAWDIILTALRIASPAEAAAQTLAAATAGKVEPLVPFAPGGGSAGPSEPPAAARPPTPIEGAAPETKKP